MSSQSIKGTFPSAIFPHDEESIELPFKCKLHNLSSHKPLDLHNSFFLPLAILLLLITCHNLHHEFMNFNFRSFARVLCSGWLHVCERFWPGTLGGHQTVSEATHPKVARPRSTRSGRVQGKRKERKIEKCGFDLKGPESYFDFI